MDGSLFSFKFVLRIVAILLVLTTFYFTAQNSVMISKGNEKIQANQLETLTKLLISQAALTASSFVEEQNQDKLIEFTNQLAKDRLVFDASIYDSEGIQLAKSSSALSVRDILGLDAPLQAANTGRQQLVEPIMHNNSIIGFIRITFETGKVTAISDHHYRKSDRYMYLMILVSFLSGVLITLLINNRRLDYKKGGENLLLKNPRQS
ncbi:YtjB family periplasmic protein [Vibrio salinus]|uniref:YtjB family periplasmic protein n=1 Tax=Vibrio salinus TaxID=2899784 RepID=UPI001E36D873|nr:YtjB family periplasmic protein [Vibrio salinus]MCE0494305.1 YtjB family periplasmic protein [Vibrio salinus]